MEEIKDAVKDIDIYKLVFIGSNREKFNFNIFRKQLNVLSAIYNGEGQVAEDLMDKIKDADKGKTYISLFLLVVIEKNLTLTFSGNN